jgi:hypothetical protein
VPRCHIEKANQHEGRGDWSTTTCSLDTIPTLEGQVIPAGHENIVHIGTGDSTYNVQGPRSGAHEIIAVIGYGDHSGDRPQQRDTVKFVVQEVRRAAAPRSHNRAKRRGISPVSP